MGQCRASTAKTHPDYLTLARRNPFRAYQSNYWGVLIWLVGNFALFGLRCSPIPTRRDGSDRSLAAQNSRFSRGA